MMRKYYVVFRVWSLPWKFWKPEAADCGSVYELEFNLNTDAGIAELTEHIKAKHNADNAGILWWRELDG